MKKAVCCGLLLGLILLSGCASRLVYNNADWWINWYVDDYLNFNRHQQKNFDAFLQQQLAWHRREELPRYQHFLRTLKTDLQQQALNRSYVAQQFDQFGDFWESILEQSIPGIETMFIGLSKAQLAEFLSNLQNEQATLEQEYRQETREQTLELRRQQIAKRLKPWVGKLNSAQQQSIAQWAETLPDIYPQSLQQRAKWQQAMAEALDNRNQSGEFRRQLYVLFVKPELLWSPEYREALQHNQQLSYQLLADLYQMADDEQRQRLFKRIDKYVKDIEKLKRG